MSDFLCPAFPTNTLQELGCAVAEFGGSVWILGVVLLLVAGAGWVAWIRLRPHRSEDSAPAVVFPVTTSHTSRAGSRGNPFASDQPAADAVVSWQDDAVNADTSKKATSHQTTDVATSTRAPLPTGARESGAELAGAVVGPEGSAAVDAGPVHFHRPLDGTLQLLPGRLEIVSGAGVGEVIRFVRVPATEPEVTFGRSEGRPHQHVQLDSPTVSRLHARFRFNGEGWTLTNLSSTNPTILNGQALLNQTESVALVNGDRIEMGEVTFVFHHQNIGDRLPYRSSWYTDRGRRASNQDAVGVRTLSDGREIAVVCDGMGSHAAGGVASHTALESLMEAFESGATLEDAVRHANRVVWSEGQKSTDHEGMATTLVVLLRNGDTYHIANVGDSRAYRVDGDKIRRLTNDHSFVAEAVRAGEMSSDEANRSPWGHVVTRMLGSEQEVDADLFGPFEASDPHLVLLCSDGVHGVMADEELMGEVLAVPRIEDLAKHLGEEALRRGGTDNVAVAAVAFAGGVQPVGDR